MFVTSNDEISFYSLPQLVLNDKAQETAKSNQNVSSTKYNGSFDCARQLYKQGGIPSFIEV